MYLRGSRVQVSLRSLLILCALVGLVVEIFFRGTAWVSQFEVEGSLYGCPQPFSSNGDMFIVVSRFGSHIVQVWDLRLEKLLCETEDHGTAICSASISQDGLTIASTEWKRISLECKDRQVTV